MLLGYLKYFVCVPFFVMVFNFILIFNANAQSLKNTDTTNINKSKADSDSTSLQTLYKSNPKKAAIYSAVCPGLGQIYNRKYWKVPIVFATIGTAFYFININYSGYTNTRNGIARLQDNDITNDELPILVKDYSFKKYDLKANGATVDDLLRIKKYFRQNLDYSILAITAIYLLNIVDANVDAHLSGFNMSDNLTIAPIVNQQGIGIALHLK